MNLGLIHSRLRRTSVHDRYTYTQAQRCIHVVLHLIAPAITIQRVRRGGHTTVHTDIRHPSGLRDIQTYVAALDGKLRTLYLRTTQQSLLIDGVQQGDGCENLLVADLGNCYIEVCLVGNLQQLLQLQFVGHQLALGLHDVILVVGALRSQLGKVSLRHLTYAHHFLSALLVLLSRLQRLLTHLHTLVDIEYLGKNLSDTLLNGISRLTGLQVSLLFRYSIELHGVGITTTVPNGPLPAQRITSIVRSLVYLCVYHTIGHRRDTRILPRLIAKTLVGRRIKCG